jgi:hypothetical protein
MVVVVLVVSYYEARPYALAQSRFIFSAAAMLSPKETYTTVFAANCAGV